MAKKRARVPKRIAGVKISKRARKRLRPLAQFLASEFGEQIVSDVLIATAIALARTNTMRQAFEDAGKAAKKSGEGLHGLVTHLLGAALLPVLAAPRVDLPDDERTEALH